VVSARELGVSADPQMTGFGEMGTTNIAFLLISAFFAERALRAGAQGYVMKKAPKEELLAAIRDIVQADLC
jgi:CheY-like chemotaxis protein